MTVQFTLIGSAHAATEGETHSETGVAHGDSGDHGGGTFPPFDPTYFASQLLWLAITFGIFYLLMSRVALPRIAGILETRRDRISQDLDEAQRLKDESDAAIAAYEHELAEARNRAHAIGQEARDASKAKADAEREAAEKELAGKMADAEARISDIKKQALGEVDAIASDTVGLIVKELIGGTVTKAEISKAVSAQTGKEAG